MGQIRIWTDQDHGKHWTYSDSHRQSHWYLQIPDTQRSRWIADTPCNLLGNRCWPFLHGEFIQPKMVSQKESYQLQVIPNPDNIASIGDKQKLMYHELFDASLQSLVFQILDENEDAVYFQQSSAPLIII